MLNYGRLSSVAANMRRCGLSQILVSDDDSIFYLIGCRIKAQERCGVLLSSHITADLERVADQIAYLHQGRLLFQEDKDRLMEELAVLRCPAAELDTLPPELILARQSGTFGPSALVRSPGRVRRLLPGAVLDKISLDEMMQFYSGGAE